MFAKVFVDFGDVFEVLDPTGEEPKEVFVHDITKVIYTTLLLCYNQSGTPQERSNSEDHSPRSYLGSELMVSQST